MSKTFIEMVTEFHKAFNHPVGDEVHYMGDDKDRKSARVSWMQEELDEYIEADMAVDKVDALVDLQYFLSGTLVEMGIDQQDWDMIYNDFLDIREPNIVDTDYIFSNLMYTKNTDKIKFGRVECPSQYRDIELCVSMQNEIDNFDNAEDVKSEIDALYFLQHAIGRTLREMSVTADQFQRCFEAVHEANMQKLWPDGKPHYNESNKVIKPEGWEVYTPEPNIEAILFG
jgi:predicted HAD superfamily Cof-like phosphohydrolase